MFGLRLVLFQLLIINLSTPISTIRLDVSFQAKRICRTTVQGRYLLSDDNGYVCDALSLDPQSRCCNGKAEQYSLDVILVLSAATRTNIVFHAA